MHAVQRDFVCDDVIHNISMKHAVDEFDSQRIIDTRKWWWKKRDISEIWKEDSEWQIRLMDQTE